MVSKSVAEFRKSCVQRGVAPRSEPSFRLSLSMFISKVLRKVWSQDPKLAEKLATLSYGNNLKLAYLRMFWALRVVDRAESDRFALKAIAEGAEDAEAAKVFVLKAYKDGDFAVTLKFKSSLERTARFKKLLANAKSNSSLLKDGFQMPALSKPYLYEPVENRLFYLLHNSLPINSGGYATRSHGLLLGMRNAGFDPYAVTRSGFPHDRGASYADMDFEPRDEVDGIPYLRNISTTEGLGRIPLKQYLTKNVARHGPLVREHKPAIIHAASNYINGVTANAVAKRHGILSIYEVRGLWEITRMSREPEYEGTDQFNLYVKMETEACQKADHVFVLTKALKAEMERRGVASEKMTVVPNGVDSDRFKPLEPDMDLKRKLGFDDNDIVVGFIGSVVEYEGLEYLLEATKQLHVCGHTNIKVMIVGDGAVLDKMKALKDKLHLKDAVIFTGRVPHHEVEKYYSIVDIAPFPRKGVPVCEMVSPLKPFEAMAMAKSVIISNVKAMTEIVTDQKTGIVVQKDDPTSLADGIRMLAENTDLRAKIGENAREFVKSDHNWNTLANRMTDKYEELIEQKKSKAEDA